MTLRIFGFKQLVTKTSAAAVLGVCFQVAPSWSLWGPQTALKPWAAASPTTIGRSVPTRVRFCPNRKWPHSRLSSYIQTLCFPTRSSGTCSWMVRVTLRWSCLGSPACRSWRTGRVQEVRHLSGSSVPQLRTVLWCFVLFGAEPVSLTNAPCLLCCSDSGGRFCLLWTQRTIFTRTPVCWTVSVSLKVGLHQSRAARPLMSAWTPEPPKSLWVQDEPSGFPQNSDQRTLKLFILSLIKSAQNSFDVEKPVEYFNFWFMVLIRTSPVLTLRPSSCMSCFIFNSRFVSFSRFSVFLLFVLKWRPNHV